MWSLFHVFYLWQGSFKREGLWVFLSLGQYHYCLWYFFSSDLYGYFHRPKKQRKKEERRPKILFCLCDSGISRFGINGKYYLTKMYVAELFEHIQQVYSLTTIYLCLMPVEISTIVCIVLIVELAINIWLTMYLDSQEIRDRLLLLDILTDIFCIAFPLLYTWLSFQIPVSIPQMLFIVVYPTLSLLFKTKRALVGLFQGGLGTDTKGNLSKNRNQDICPSSRSKSILNLPHHHDRLRMQLKYFPKCLRYFFIVVNIGFLMFFISLISVHLATQPSRDTCIGIYTKEVWDGCKVESSILPSIVCCRSVIVA